MRLKVKVPCTHEMRTMHLIREQVGCTVHVKKGRRKRKKKGPKLLRCSFFIFGHLFNKFCLCWPAHVLFSARIWYIIYIGSTANTLVNGHMTPTDAEGPLIKVQAKAANIEP